MNFQWNYLVDKKIIEFLDKSLSRKNLANFYIFSGPANLGKFSLAKNFSQNIFLSDGVKGAKRESFLENNSDFLVIEKELDKKNISIDQIRELIGNFRSSSFLNSYRIAIIKNGEDLSESAANALLKILEEAPAKVIIIMTLNNSDSLLSTIISRAQVINFLPLPCALIYQDLINNFSLSPTKAKELARLSLGRPALALKFYQEESFYRAYQELASSFLLFLAGNFSERFKIIDDALAQVKNNPDIDLIELWQSIIRDLIFINTSIYDQVRNYFLLEDLEKIVKDGPSLSELREKLLFFEEGRDLLSANLGLKSALERIAINL